MHSSWTTERVRRRGAWAVGCLNAALLVLGVAALILSSGTAPATARAVGPAAGGSTTTEGASTPGGLATTATTSNGGAASAGASPTPGASAPATVTARTTGPSSSAGESPAAAPVVPTARANAGLGPARAGAYAYDTSGSASYGFGTTAFPSVTTLTVDAPVGTQQHSVRRLLDGSGNGFVVDQTADYLPDGIHLVKLVLTMTLQGTTTVRTLRASEGMLLPTGAAPGTSQSFALTGSGIGGQETASVTGPGSATVGGATVATVGLKMVLTLSGGATGTIEWDQAFAPAFRLPAAESASASVAVGPVTVDLHYHCALQRPPA